MDKEFKENLLTKFDKLGQEMNRMNNQIKEMDVKLKKLDLLEELKKEIRENSEKVASLEFEIEELKIEKIKNEAENFKTIQTLENKIDAMENQQRRNNIVISGLKEDKNETWDQTEKIVVDFLKNKLDLSVELERAHRLGAKKLDNDRPRLVIARLTSFKDKALIFKNANKLKGSGSFINEDFATKTREQRAKLIKFAKLKHPGKKFKLKVNRIQIDNKWYELGLVGIIEVKS